MAKITLRGRLIELVEKHPDWTYKMYAEALNQSQDTIRGVFHKLNFKYTHSIKKATNPRKKPKVKKPVILQVSHEPVAHSRSGSYRYGYTKLL